MLLASSRCKVLVVSYTKKTKKYLLSYKTRGHVFWAQRDERVRRKKIFLGERRS